MRNDDDDDDDEEFHVKFREDPHEVPSTLETPLITEYHILWSMSYGVPVIYFNRWKSCNSSLITKKTIIYLAKNVCEKNTCYFCITLIFVERIFN